MIRTQSLWITALTAIATMTACQRSCTRQPDPIHPPSQAPSSSMPAIPSVPITLPILDAPPPTRLSLATSTQPAQHAAIAMDQNGRAHVVWQDSCMQVGPEQCPFGHDTAVVGAGQQSTLPPDIVYQRIPDAPVLISTGGAHGRSDGASSSPAIAVSAEGVAHVVWSETGSVAHATSCPNRMCDAQIVYRSIAPSGALSPIHIVSTSADRSDFASIGIAPDGHGPVYVVWFAAEASKGALYYRRLTSGKKWSHPVRFATVTSPRTFPRVAVDSAGYAHVVWHDDPHDGANDSKIYYAVIAPSHQSEKITAQWVSDNPRFHNARNPDIAIVSNIAFIVWKDQGSYLKPGAVNCVPHCETDIILTGRTIVPNGTGSWITFNTETASIRRFDRISTAKSLPNKDALQPSVSGSGTSFIVAWRDTSTATDDIVLRRGTIPSHGQSANYNFLDTVRVAPQPGASHSPRIAMDKTGHAAVVWVDEAPSPAHINVVQAAMQSPIPTRSPPDSP